MRSLLVVLLFAGGCYHPEIGEGEFACGGTELLCPEGFKCGPNGRCFRPEALDTFDFALAPFRGTGEIGSRILAMPGTLVLDTGTGEIKIGTVTVVPKGTGFKLFPQTDGPPVVVWSFTDLTIPAGMDVTIAPNNVAIPVLAATGTLVVNGRIRLSGFGAPGGAPGMNGKSRDTNAQTPGGGGGKPPGGGGGGGGYGTTGNAGISGGGGMGGSGGPTFGNPDIAQLHMGTGGGGGGGVGSGPGGNGGGAIALFAKTIEIGGQIDCNGSDGAQATNTASGGGGGGAGGSILLSAGSIKFTAGNSLSAVGGKGATAATPGEAGGAGGAGRIWIGSMTTASGAVTSMPMAKFQEGMAGVLTQFPR